MISVSENHQKLEARMSYTFAYQNSQLEIIKKWNRLKQVCLQNPTQGDSKSFKDDEFPFWFGTS